MCGQSSKVGRARREVVIGREGKLRHLDGWGGGRRINDKGAFKVGRAVRGKLEGFNCLKQKDDGFRKRGGVTGVVGSPRVARWC